MLNVGFLSMRLFLTINTKPFMMVTFTRLLPLLFLCFFSSALWGQNAKTDAVLAQENRRFELMIKADTAALRAILSDDLVYLHSNALQENKTDHLNALGARKLSYSKMQRENAAVRFYGRTALVNGRLNAAGVLNGNPFDIKLLYTAVYLKKRDRWLLLNWQSTRIP